MAVHWKIEVIEDDPALARAVATSLRREGYRVRSAGTAAEGLAVLREWSPDLVLLDLMLPDCDSERVLGQFRSETAAGLVGMTALSSLADVVAGLRVGADDYVTKPFSLDELTARVAAVLRRVHAAPRDVIEIGGLRIDAAGGTAVRDGRDLRLTATELRLLLALVQNQGRVLTQAQISEAIWAADTSRVSNTIEVHIGRLRRKLGGDGRPPFIQTVRGMGYMLKVEGKQ